jgi:ribosomal protein S18 acetylase RimI-like enzyme
VDVPPISVEDLDEAGFEAYVERTVPAYAAEGARATGMSEGEALAEARHQFESLLPDGVRTKGQHFKRVRDGAGAEVGLLWYAAQLDASPSCLFLYDVVVAEARRGQGLGTACMRWLETEARRLGAEQVALHVFTHNVRAVDLYERLGFVVTLRGEGGMRMAKVVGADD